MVQNGKLNIAMKGKPALSTPHVQNPVNATHVIANTSTGNDSEVDARGFKTFKSRPLRFARREEPRGGVIIFRSAAAALGEENIKLPSARSLNASAAELGLSSGAGASSISRRLANQHSSFSHTVPCKALLNWICRVFCENEPGSRPVMAYNKVAPTL